MTIPAEEGAISKNDTADNHKDDRNVKRDKQEAYPKVFYCPITKKLLKDPVVAPDGISYERSAKEAQQRQNVTRNEKLYRNLALASIMEDREVLYGKSRRAGVLRWQRSVQQSMQRVVANSMISSGEHRSLPDAFYCPITIDLLRVPIIDPEGNTFEKAAIVEWVRSNGKSSLTRSSLSVHDLYPNSVISDLLIEEAGRGEDSIHPSIGEWKAEAPEQGDEENLETTSQLRPNNWKSAVKNAVKPPLTRPHISFVWYFQYAFCTFRFLHVFLVL